MILNGFGVRYYPDVIICKAVVESITTATSPVINFNLMCYAGILICISNEGLEEKSLEHGSSTGIVYVLTNSAIPGIVKIEKLPEAQLTLDLTSYIQLVIHLSVHVQAE